MACSKALLGGLFLGMQLFDYIPCSQLFARTLLMIDKIDTCLKFFGFNGSSFLCNGITLDTFQSDGNLFERIERFTIWVMAGRIYCVASLIVKVSIESKPNDFEFFKLDKISLLCLDEHIII